MIRFLVIISLTILFVSSGNNLVFTENCDAPFGDKDTTDASTLELLGKVRDVDFGKNADGSWHIKKCQLETVRHQGTVLVDVLFKQSYPSHQNLKKNDWVCITTGGGTVNHRGLISRYNECELYENFTESAKECTVKPPNGRMHANVVIEEYTRGGGDALRRARNLAQQYVELQCVVVALQYMENPDIGPDHDFDVVIDGIVVKCGDGNLYGVSFYSNWAETEHKKKVIRMPGKGVFSEGDKVILRVSSIFPIFDDDPPPMSYEGQFATKDWKDIE